MRPLKLVQFDIFWQGCGIARTLQPWLRSATVGSVAANLSENTVLPSIRKWDLGDAMRMRRLQTIKHIGFML